MSNVTQLISGKVICEVNSDIGEDNVKNKTI